MLPPVGTHPETVFPNVETQKADLAPGSVVLSYIET
jgi:hypothetical protein